MSRPGELPNSESLINVSDVLDNYYSLIPNSNLAEEKVVFGTSGHRGSSLKKSFNETHILAITQAIVNVRKSFGIDGSLFIGFDTHILSIPAFKNALEVLVANDVEVRIDNHITKDVLEMAVSGNPSKGLAIWTPTPAISHAIIKFNQEFSKQSLSVNSSLWNGKTADGIVVTPSHNPPTDGGFKYNPPNGGPADSDITKLVAQIANELIENNLNGVKRIDFDSAFEKVISNGWVYDFRQEYVKDLENIIDLKLIKNKKVKIGADPLGGAAVDYWSEIAKVYDLDLTVLNETVDPTFRFMTLDWDSKIRMDCSSVYSMNGLVESVGNSGKFDIMTGNDADSDRHGIVTPDAKENNGEFTAGLMNPNHFLAVAIDYLYSNREAWGKKIIGKTLVSSSLIDKVADGLNLELSEVPVGFKWFVPGLIDSSFGFGGEESAGASFLRFNGDVWTTDKDGIIMCLLAAEIFAKTSKSPALIHRELTDKYGVSYYARIDAPASLEEKDKLSKLSPELVKSNELAGEKIIAKLTKASGNNAGVGGLKVVTENAWFAARPSGTENVYKIYAESFISKDHLETVQNEAKQIVKEAIS